MMMELIISVNSVILLGFTYFLFFNNQSKTCNGGTSDDCLSCFETQYRILKL